MILLIVASSNVLAEWILYATRENGDSLYIDKPIKHNKNSESIWFINDFSKDKDFKGDAYKSQKLHADINCKGKQVKTRAIYIHSGNIGQGELIGYENFSNEPWVDIPPGSQAENLWEVACKNKWKPD